MDFPGFTALCQRRVPALAIGWMYLSGHHMLAVNRPCSMAAFEPWDVHLRVTSLMEAHNNR